MLNGMKNFYDLNMKALKRAKKFKQPCGAFKKKGGSASAGMIRRIKLRVNVDGLPRSSDSDVLQLSQTGSFVF